MEKIELFAQQASMTQLLSKSNYVIERFIDTEFKEKEEEHKLSSSA